MSNLGTQGADRDDTTTPAPDDPRKPENPTDLHKRSWLYVLRKTVREFGEDQCTDLAAALTFYSVLALFPAGIALVSVLGVVGQAEDSVALVVDVLRPLVSDSTLGTIEPALEQVASTSSAGWALALGLLGALWSASGYVGAFGRAMNRIYEIGEGRPVWKLRPAMLLLTVVMILLLAALLVMLVVSGGLARSVGEAVGLSDQAVTIWSLAKWPVVAFVVVVLVALLYWGTPNVKQPKFRWLSVGAVVALVVAALASYGFTVYVANFASYNKTYGSLAGAVIALLYLWLVNLALLFGAELDAELERGRQLQAGIAAEHELQLPARDTRNIEKARAREAEDVERGRAIRRPAEASSDADGVRDHSPDNREAR